jgi:cell division septation protein DedD
MTYGRLDGWYVLTAELLGTIILIALCVVAASQVGRQQQRQQQQQQPHMSSSAVEASTCIEIENNTTPTQCDPLTGIVGRQQLLGEQQTVQT